MPRGRGASRVVAPSSGRRRSARLSSREGSAAAGSSTAGASSSASTSMVGGNAYIDETIPIFNADFQADAGDGHNLISLSTIGVRRARVDSENDPEVENDPTTAPKRPKVEDEEDENKFADMSSFRADDGDCCTICFCEFTATGDHRLVCLKCGHLFGKSCIERWVKVEKNNRCPTCKAPARSTDIRPLFGKITSGDNSEVVTLKSRLKALMVEKDKLELKLTETENALKATMQAFDEFRSLHTPKVVTNAKTEIKVSWAIKKMVISPGAACRGLSFSPLGNFLVAGCETLGNTNTLTHSFFVFNFKKQATNLRLAVHSAILRAIEACPFDSRYVASVAEDQHLMIRDITQPNINVPQQKFKLQTHAFCLCWLSETELVVGLKNGRVHKYSRVATGFEDLTEGEGTVPIINVQYDYNYRTLFVASARQISAYRHGRLMKLVDPGEHRRFQSFHYDPVSQCFLITVPSTKNEPVLLQLYKVQFGSPLTVSQIGEHKTTSSNTTCLLTNIVWMAPSCDLISAFYDEDHSVTTILNWGPRKDQHDPKQPAELVFLLKQDPGDGVVRDILYLTREDPSTNSDSSTPVNQLAILTRTKMSVYYIKYN